MDQIRFRRAIRLLWTAAALSLIGVLMFGPGAGVRLWLLTALALLAAPSALVTAPAANWLIGRLDLEGTRSIDLWVGTTVAVFGYIQWFVVPVIYKRWSAQARSLSRTIPNEEERGGRKRNEQPGDDASVAVHYGDDSECLSLKMLLEGSGISASLRNFSMSGGGLGRTDVGVFVGREDLDRVRPLVEHFQEHLRNSPKR